MRIMKFLDIVFFIIAMLCLGLCVYYKSWVGVFGWSIATVNSIRIIVEYERYMPWKGINYGTTSETRKM